MDILDDMGVSKLSVFFKSELQSIYVNQLFVSLMIITFADTRGFRAESGFCL